MRVDFFFLLPLPDDLVRFGPERLRLGKSEQQPARRRASVLASRAPQRQIQVKAIIHALIRPIKSPLITEEERPGASPLPGRCSAAAVQNNGPRTASEWAAWRSWAEKGLQLFIKQEFVADCR